jgi:hypothetical protein
MKSSRDRVLYLELSANSHEVGAFMLRTLLSGVDENGFWIGLLAGVTAAATAPGSVRGARDAVGAWRWLPVEVSGVKM